MIGPAASPMSQIVPNTPMAAPRRRAEARSAISALVTGVTAAMPKPRIGATMTKVMKSSLRKISGSAAAHRREADNDDRLSTNPSERRPPIGFATTAVASWLPRTIAISASLSPTVLA